MKTARTSSLKISPELRQAVESVLKEGETLSSFVEQSVRTKIQQREFIARGLASRDEAKRTGIYYSHEEVMAELNAKLEANLE